jgi:hypothetical protein
MRLPEPLFLVVSETRDEPLFRRPLDLEGFRFDTAPLRRGWQPGLGPVVLVKLDERPLVELVDDLSAWTSPDVFNRRERDGSYPVQEHLRAVIRAARARPGDPFLEPFRRIVADPDWQGMLAIDPPLAADGLPLQLHGLAGGMPAPLRGHHVGVEVAGVRLDALLANLHGTAFGLLRYAPRAPRLLRGEPASLDYEVQDLDVLFADSAVAAFSANVLLTVRNLFDRPLALRGSLRREGGTTAFDIATAEPEGLPRSHASFTTLSRTVFESGRTEVRARFALDGALDVDVAFALPGGQGPAVDRTLTLTSPLVAASR